MLLADTCVAAAKAAISLEFLSTQKVVCVHVSGGRERERERVWTNPKADHLINRRVVGRAKCLRVVATTPYARQKERRERETDRETERQTERQSEGGRERGHRTREEGAERRCSPAYLRPNFKGKKCRVYPKP